MSENEPRTRAAGSGTECRALTVRPGPAESRSADRPLAAFLAQLIACKRRLPPFRRACRAEPAVARSSYGAGGPQAPRRFEIVV